MGGAKIRTFALALLLGCTTSAAAADGNVVPKAEPAAVDSAPVEIDGNVLFRVRGTISFPAERRARLIAQRIEAAGADPAMQADKLRVVPGNGTIEIAVGDTGLLSLHEADATLEQLTLPELAEAHRRRITAAIGEYR